jgi:peptidoglycan hydrolase CwlO-like protein
MRRPISLIVAISTVGLVGCVTTGPLRDGSTSDRVSTLEQRVGPGSGNEQSLVDQIAQMRKDQLAMARKVEELTQGLTSTQRDLNKVGTDVDRLKERTNLIEDTAKGATTDLSGDLKEFQTSREGIDRKIRELADQNAKTDANVTKLDKTLTERMRTLEKAQDDLYKDIMGTLENSSTPGGPSPTRGTAYIIQKGDTMGNVARRCGISLKALMNANPDIRNANTVSVGQRIQIP